MKRIVLILCMVSGAVIALVFWNSEPETIAEKGVEAEVKTTLLPSGDHVGRQLFSKNCASCHGANGVGTQNGPPFIHKVYEPNHHSDMAFQLAAKRGVRQHHWNFGNMPPIGDVTEEEVAETTRYVRKLQRASGVY